MRLSPAPARLSRPLVRLPVLLAALAALALLPGCSSGPRAPAASRFQGAAFPPGVRARPFTLRDEQGRTVSLSASAGTVRLLAFLSTRGPGGALVAQQIRGALDDLGPGLARRVTTLIVSTDPVHDTPVRARALLAQAALTGRARYLLGTRTQLQALWRAYGVLPASAGERAFVQSTPVLLVDGAGVERVGFAVEQLTPEGLAHDMRALIS